MNKMFKCHEQLILDWLAAKGREPSWDGMFKYLNSNPSDPSIGIDGSMNDRLLYCLQEYEGDINHRLTQCFADATGITERGASDQAFFSNPANNIGIAT